MMNSGMNKTRTLDFQYFDGTQSTAPTSVTIDLTPGGRLPQGEGQNKNKFTTFWNIDFYQRFFDVDTSEVVDKIKWSFIPYGNFLQNFITSKPDLYGPFWICVTLISVIAITGNLSDYLQSQSNSNSHWKYEFHTITTAAMVIFFYASIFPCLLWTALRWYGFEHENLKLIELISLYGYSLSIFVPLACLWLIPYRWFQWTVTILGATSSGLVLIKSIYPIFTKQIYPFLILPLILHVYVASTLMINFYQVSSSISKKSNHQS